MKSTDRQLFLRHQKRCVKCRKLKEMRITRVGDPDLFRLLKLHEMNMEVLYHLRSPHDALEFP